MIFLNFFYILKAIFEVGNIRKESEVEINCEWHIVKAMRKAVKLRSHVFYSNVNLWKSNEQSIAKNLALIWVNELIISEPKGNIKLG